MIRSAKKLCGWGENIPKKNNKNAFLFRSAKNCVGWGKNIPKNNKKCIFVQKCKKVVESHTKVPKSVKSSKNAQKNSGCQGIHFLSNSG